MTWITVACALVMIAGPAMGATETPVAVCPLVEQGPEIDGRLDDAAWEGAEALGAFIRHDDSGPAGQQTEALVCTDAQTLFIGCELYEDSMQNLADESVEHDDPRIFRQDVVELFIRPDLNGEEYFHLAASAAGSRYEAITTGGPIDWTPQWQVATSQTQDRWVLEVAIPLEEVRLSGVEAGDAIGLNICREEQPHEELSCWSPTLGPFHNASRFGELVFFSVRPLVEARLERVESAVKAVREAGNEEAAADLQGRYEALSEQAEGEPDAQTWAGLRSQLAALADDTDRLALQAREAIVWQVNPWSLPAHTELPGRDVSEVDEVQVRLLQGEYETVALGIANPGERSLAYHVSATDLLRWHEDEEVSAEGRIELREAVSLRTRTGGMVRDALPGLGPAGRVVVPPGENTIVWVTLHADELGAGRYLAGIELLPMVGEQTRTVRLQLMVYPAELPREAPPWLNTWAYLSRAEERGWEDEASRDLYEHYCNINLVQHNDVPWPTVDAEGNITEPLDWTTFDARMRELPPDSFYLLSLAMHWWEDLKTELEPWTPEHRNALRQWALAVRDGLKERGIGYDRFAWYPRDEPSTDEQAELVRNFAETVHEADPRMNVFANPYSRSTPEQIRVMGEEIDIWCPSLGGLRDEDLRYMKEHGRRLWSYRVLSRLSNPYRGYRAPFWQVWEMGGTGYGFWSYDNIDGSCWDDFDGRVSDYAVSYEGPDGPITSVRWEAAREGAEDFRLLRMLTDAGAKLREAGDDEAADRAEGAVEEAVAAVLDEQADSAVADAMHGRLVDALMAARVTLGEVDETALAALRRPAPVCITGNGGPRVRNADTGGWYTYDTFPTHDWNEQCEATEGRVWFDGADATEGPQTENGIGGDLVDGSWFYRRQYVNLWIWSPNTAHVTFDLMSPWNLQRVDLFAGNQEDEKRRLASLQVLVSETGEEGSFRPIGEIADAPSAELGAQDEYQVPVEATGRYLRLIARKKGQSMVLGEVRVWGTPAQ